MANNRAAYRTVVSPITSLLQFKLTLFNLDICNTSMHDCHQNAKCSSAMSNWEYNCTCNEGFSGNGTDCEGKFLKKILAEY